jgi:hypothetical protein
MVEAYHCLRNRRNSTGYGALPLTLLTPNIVEAILDGRQPEGITLPALMEPFAAEWERQGRERRLR